MGGAVALQVHRRQTKAWDGAILLAPMCKVSEHNIFCTFIAQLWPNVTDSWADLMWFCPQIADNMIPPAIVVATLKFLARLVPRWKVVPTQDICELAFRVPEKQRKAASLPALYMKS